MAVEARTGYAAVRLHAARSHLTRQGALSILRRSGRHKQPVGPHRPEASTAAANRFVAQTEEVGQIDETAEVGSRGPDQPRCRSITSAKRIGIPQRSQFIVAATKDRKHAGKIVMRAPFRAQQTLLACRCGVDELIVGSPPVVVDRVPSIELLYQDGLSAH